MPHKVFVSYHHERDQFYATELRDFYGAYDALIDRSLPDEIDSDDDGYILAQIRQKHLRDSTVTVVLIGECTWARKWVDWEIYSSLRPYGSRTINGLLGILLPNGHRLPDRFADNYREIDTVNGPRQVGYARLVRWEVVAPPNGWRLPGLQSLLRDEIAAKRRALMDWVQRAFDNRTRDDLIDNSRPRMRRNRACPESTFRLW